MMNAEGPLKPIERDGKLYCPGEHCTNKLRSDNTRGVCAKCLKKPGMRSRQQGFVIGSTELPDESALDRVNRRVAGTAKQIDKQFNQLATALGLDPDELLLAHKEQWLKQTKARALREREGTDEARLAALDDDDQ